MSRTIFQKHSLTAKLRLRVVIWDEFTTPPLKILDLENEDYIDWRFSLHKFGAFFKIKKDLRI